MGSRTWVLVLAAGLLVLAGCDRRGAEAPAETDGAPVAEDPAEDPAVEAERPDERVDTLWVEGMREEERLVLYQSPPDYPLGFTTYVSENLAVAREEGGEADEVLFFAAFGGVRNEAAAVRVLVHRAGATELEVVEVLRQLARDLGTELSDVSDERVYDWSVREFRNTTRRFTAEAAQGRMALGVRGDRYFTVAIHYPAEYGDGFEPRAQSILREWRWLPSGEPLLAGDRGG